MFQVSAAVGRSLGLSLSWGRSDKLLVQGGAWR